MICGLPDIVFAKVLKKYRGNNNFMQYAIVVVNAYMKNYFSLVTLSILMQQGSNFQKNYIHQIQPVRSAKNLEKKYFQFYLW